MQISVAQMAEDDIAYAGQRGVEGLLGTRQERRYPRYREADVVLHIRTFALLRFGNMFAQIPELRRLGFGLCNHGVARELVA